MLELAAAACNNESKDENDDDDDEEEIELPEVDDRPVDEEIAARYYEYLVLKERREEGFGNIDEKKTDTTPKKHVPTRGHQGQSGDDDDDDDDDGGGRRY